VLLVALAACGSKTGPSEDAKQTTPTPKEGGPAPTADAGPPALGDAGVRVEWKSVTTAARTSPGRTTCKTPRAPSVAPTTMWGIPEAIVIVEGATTTPGEARITLAECTLSPRVAVGTTLVVESAVDRPAKLALAKHGTVADLANLTAGESRVIQLPIAGHAVSIALEPNGVYQLTFDADSEPAWIVAAPAAITDASGLATQRAPAGPHAVTAWVPARGGQPMKLTKSTITVEPNQLVEVAVDLGP
jgi:hypothetical protein